MAVTELKLRWDATCAQCSVALAAKSTAFRDAETKRITCSSCHEAVAAIPDVTAEGPRAADTTIETGSLEPLTAHAAPVSAPAKVAARRRMSPVATKEPPADPSKIDTGVAGASAAAEFQRRESRRIQKIEDQWGTGKIGSVAKFFSTQPQSTTAWAQGAAGERRIAEVLGSLGPTAVVLHDRRVPRSTANIDHIVIAQSGVWVIDAKKYSGRIEVVDVGGWFKTDLRLRINGRDRSPIADAVLGQIRTVRAASGGDETVSINGVLAFVGAEWGLFPKTLTFNNVVLCWPLILADVIRKAPVALTDEQVQSLGSRLAHALPAK